MKKRHILSMLLVVIILAVTTLQADAATKKEAEEEKTVIVGFTACKDEITKPVIKVAPTGNEKEGKYYKKISFVFTGKGIIEYGFNGCCDEFEEPYENVYFANVTSKTPNCHKGRNKIWIYDEKLQKKVSFVFYLK